jgi:hypothetical protein
MPRIPVAVLLFLLGFPAYVALAVTLADPVWRVPWPWSTAAQAIYFLAAGLLWVLPTRWLMYWAAGRR